MIQRQRRLMVAILISLLITVASAQGGLSFGVSLNPLDLVTNANVSVPMFVTGEAQHAARADVSYAFSGLPALSATYLLRDSESERVQTYLGAGLGVGFLSGVGVTPVLSLHALSGATVDGAPDPVRIAGGLGAFGEVIVGGNALATNLRFAAGLNYTLGGSR